LFVDSTLDVAVMKTVIIVIESWGKTLVLQANSMQVMMILNISSWYCYYTSLFSFRRQNQLVLSTFAQQQLWKACGPLEDCIHFRSNLVVELQKNPIFDLSRISTQQTRSPATLSRSRFVRPIAQGWPKAVSARSMPLQSYRV
jgi:hypothetical protein